MSDHFDSIVPGPEEEEKGMGADVRHESLPTSARQMSDMMPRASEFEFAMGSGGSPCAGQTAVTSSGDSPHAQQTMADSVDSSHAQQIMTTSGDSSCAEQKGMGSVDSSSAEQMVPTSGKSSYAEQKRMGSVDSSHAKQIVTTSGDSSCAKQKGMGSVDSSSAEQMVPTSGESSCAKQKRMGSVDSSSAEQIVTTSGDYSCAEQKGMGGVDSSSAEQMVIGSGGSSHADRRATQTATGSINDSGSFRADEMAEQAVIDSGSPRADRRAEQVATDNGHSSCAEQKAERWAEQWTDQMVELRWRERARILQKVRTGEAGAGRLAVLATLTMGMTTGEGSRAAMFVCAGERFARQATDALRRAGSAVKTYTPTTGLVEGGARETLGAALLGIVETEWMRGDMKQKEAEGVVSGVSRCAAYVVEADVARAASELLTRRIDADVVRDGPLADVAAYPPTYAFDGSGDHVWGLTLFAHAHYHTSGQVAVCYVLWPGSPWDPLPPPSELAPFAPLAAAESRTAVYRAEAIATTRRALLHAGFESGCRK